MIIPMPVIDALNSTAQQTLPVHVLVEAIFSNKKNIPLKYEEFFDWLNNIQGTVHKYKHTLIVYTDDESAVLVLQYNDNNETTAILQLYTGIISV